MSGFDSITLAPAPFVKGAVIKIASGRNLFTDPKSVRVCLSKMQGFKSQGALHAHRYNGQADGTNSAPPRCAGDMPIDLSIPATAVYVVWSYDTPIAWVDHDNRVTVPDVTYSRTTTHHQHLCRVYIPSAQ